MNSIGSVGDGSVQSQVTSLPSIVSTVASYTLYITDYDKQNVNVLQARIAKLCSKIQSEVSVSQNVTKVICDELQNIGAAIGLTEYNAQEKIRQVTCERDQMRLLITDNQRLLHNSLAERDRACQERDHLQAMASDGLGSFLDRGTLGRLKQTEIGQRKQLAYMRNTIQRLQGQITLMEGQLQAKNFLGVHNHLISGSGSSADVNAKTVALADDDANTHVTSNALVLHADTSSNKSSKSFDGTHDDKTSNECSDDVQSVQPLSLVGPFPEALKFTSLPASATNESQKSKPFDMVKKEFTADISEIWNMCERLAMQYFHVPNPVHLDARLPQQKTWDFILGLTYPDQADAAAHTITLLRHTTTRSFFVTRMCISFIIIRVWSFTQWCDHNNETQNIVNACMIRLKETQLSQAERAATVATLTKRVIWITSQPDYNVYRIHKLSILTKGLRQLLGPILNVEAVREDAGHVISDLVTKAFDSAVKIHCSYWQFTASFPAAGSKFLAHSMRCRNLLPGDNESAVQNRQARLGLCISPIVTMRDDRGLSIRVKQILSADCLVVQ